MALLTSDGWRRCDRQEPCLLCGKPDWCTVSPDGIFACCMRIMDGAIRQVKNGGYLHALKARNDSWKRPAPLKMPAPPIELPDIPTLDGQRLFTEAKTLGVDIAGLIDLDTRTYGNSIAFPMKDSTETIIGYRLRDSGGAKYCIRGSRNGLFIPARKYPADPWDYEDWVFAVEGPTDTAAMLSMNLQAVGRPSNTGGHDMLLAWLSPFRRVVVLADRDRNEIAEVATMTAASRLATALRSGGRQVRLMRLPAKDARQWYRAGGTKLAVLAILGQVSA